MSSAIIAATDSRSPLWWVSMKRCSSVFSSSVRSGDECSRRSTRAVCAHRRARPLQRAVGRGDARAERLGGVLRRPVEHVAQHHDRALARRQRLDQRDVGELDRLARDDDGVGLLLARGDLVEQPVGVRLQPRDVAERVLGRHAALRPAQLVEADVRRDPVQPRAKLLALEGVAVAPGAQERLLHASSRRRSCRACVAVHVLSRRRAALREPCRLTQCLPSSAVGASDRARHRAESWSQRGDPAMRYTCAW